MVDGIRFEIALNALTLRFPEKVKDGVCKFCDQPVDRDGMFCLSCLPDIEAIGSADYGKAHGLLYRACGFNRFAGRPASRSNVPKLPPPTTVAACGHCGASFDKWHPKKRFCSQRCNQIAEKRRARARKNPDYKPRILGVCQHCGDSCETYVCGDCRQVSVQEYRKLNYDKIRNSKRTYRKALRGVASESYKKIEIAERDGWRCQLCKKKVDRRLKYPHVMSMSIDHIVPISQGGTDVRSNVQLAHFRCNSIKHNNVWGEGEQLRLLG